MYNSYRDLLEDEEILFEGDDDGGSDDNGGGGDGGDDNDDDDDGDENVNLDIKQKSKIQDIKNSIDKLIVITQYLIVTKKSTEYYEILVELFKTRKLFELYITNYNDYEDDQHSKIIVNFQKVIYNISKKIKSE